MIVSTAKGRRNLLAAGAGQFEQAQLLAAKTSAAWRPAWPCRGSHICLKVPSSIVRSAFRKPRTMEPVPPREAVAGLSDDSAIIRRDVAMGQYLIDANIRLMLLPRPVLLNATRARYDLRVDQ